VIIGIERQQLQSALNTDHNTTENIYREEGIPILSKFSKTIRSLNLDSRYFNGMIRILNTGCVNLTTLSVLDDEEKSILFTDPNQLSLLHNLPALNSLTFAFNCSLQEYGYNTAHKTVTEINIAIKGTSLLDDLDICWILSIFPLLQKIRIEYSNARLVCYQDLISGVFPSLSSITFGVSAVHPKLFSMLYKIAPNIEQVGLTIYGNALRCSIQERLGALNLILPEVSLQTTDLYEANYKIDLNDWELKELDLNVEVAQGMSGDEGFVLVVKSNYFIVSRDFSRISAERYSLSDEYEELYRIIIDAPCAKTIRISNARVIINPRLGSIRFY
jgi:hypothetical protein